jgi:hypothetical protein
VVPRVAAARGERCRAAYGRAWRRRGGAVEKVAPNLHVLVTFPPRTVVWDRRTWCSVAAAAGPTKEEYRHAFQHLPHAGAGTAAVRPGGPRRPAPALATATQADPEASDLEGLVTRTRGRTVPRSADAVRPLARPEPPAIEPPRRPSGRLGASARRALTASCPHVAAAPAPGVRSAPCVAARNLRTTAVGEAPHR